MRMYDLIRKKRDGGELSNVEIQTMIADYVTGEIPDYQMSAMLMAIYFKGMTAEETACLTMAMARSGDMVNLDAIQGIKVDKHSTGGVGDKTTLIIAPIAAACGVKIAKMSGRGLGHTGGTVDKMESIPGMRTDLEREDFFRVVNAEGLCVIGQSGNLVPADKKLYALRDVTATVESIPLIAASIMSKKLAAGSDCILLDVKTGSGAFMKTVEDSVALAKAMVDIGEEVGRHVEAMVSNMDIPLGHNIGNSLEVAEAVLTLQGKGPEDLTEVCLELAAAMMAMAGLGDRKKCRVQAERAITDGSALKKLKAMVKAQGGDVSVIEDTERFAKASYEVPIIATREILGGEFAYVGKIDTQQCGIAAMMLGAGREKKEDRIDYTAGICLKKKYGELVQAGEMLAVLYTSEETRLEQSRKVFLEAYQFCREIPSAEPLIYAHIDKNGVNYI